MNLVINGSSRAFDAAAFTVTSLLEALGLAGKPVVVELDREPVFPADYATTEVKEGANVEIVTIAAGG
ncbi:sulfur carrier protein ThiS [Luteolibacter flavescens]|uniref:Sulfur carrier protein ThiS n=1 Tax=Luteolibacter flavescens TaxID=1859460 RepID=A0ABT3FW59_9BACT|nr:sulfur carrier protein ThiS [Luteolibacter flavescens]MCW1887814.1 sulfur carrier protein ThiS [Luteolibacter flavescens]